MSRVRNLLKAAVLAALAGCGGGGGGSGSPTTPPVPTPEPVGPATRTVIDLRNWSLKGGAGTPYNQDALPEGTLDVTLEWQNGDNDIQLFVTAANSCPGTVEVQGGACPVYASSTDPKEKPKRLTYAVPAGKPSLAVWVVNASRQSESGSLEVGITSREKPATPAPGATPTPDDYRSTLPDGPVVSAFIKVRSIEEDRVYRDPFQDSNGFWILYVNEFVVFDLTQRNAANQECKWVNDPTWEISDTRTLRPRGSSQPFLLRVDVLREGEVEVVGRIDGVTSNVLKVRASKKP
jgi:hypothetical protein